MIDTDLGVSGRWGVARAGFAELVSRVCTGEVGAIFGLEISRLARSNAEVARLMEFAAITATLLIDADGVYDPADVNDRMLLRLKSTMGEVELHVMAQRLQAAKRAAGARGELRTPLPVGYVHDDADAVVLDPDAEVRAAIADLFAVFAACGSADRVVAAFAGRRFPLRAYGGVWAGQLRWGRLSHARVLGVLKNPATPGHTCTAATPRRGGSTPRVACTPASPNAPAPSGRCSSATTTRATSAGAPTWPTKPNWPPTVPTPAPAPPREGTALCQGIIACGSCGKPMRTNYHSDQRPAYECSGRADRATTPTCRPAAAATDDAVAGRLLAALNPHEVALAIAAAVADRHTDRCGAALAVQRAHYEG